MKKTLIITLGALLVCTFVSCGKNNDKTGLVTENNNNSQIESTNQELNEKTEDEKLWDSLESWSDDDIENRTDYRGLSLKEGLKKAFKTAITIDISDVKNNGLVKINIPRKSSETSTYDMRMEFNDTLNNASSFLSENGVKKIQIDISDENDSTYRLETNSYELYGDYFEWMGRW